MTHPLPPPGWYPDPSAPSSTRYWDGAQWTAHRAPAPPPIVINNVVAPPAPVVAVSSGPNHALHLILTLLTCGMWLPIWVIVALFSPSGVRVATPMNQPGPRAVTPGPRGFVSAHAELVVIGTALGLIVAIAFWKVALPIALIGLLIWGAVTVIRNTQRQTERRRQAAAAVAARADMQHQAMMRGDRQVGTFGQFQPADFDPRATPPQPPNSHL